MILEYPSGAAQFLCPAFHASDETNNFSCQAIWVRMHGHVPAGKDDQLSRLMVSEDLIGVLSRNNPVIGVSDA